MTSFLIPCSLFPVPCSLFPTVLFKLYFLFQKNILEVINMVYLPDTLELTINLSDEQFFQLCQDNRDLRFERTSEGYLIIMSPTGGNTGRRNIKLSTQLELWSSQMKLGVAFDSNTGFKLPNGANRSPDASWIKRERWEELTPEQQDKFVPLCPDFV
ncbi:Uma2 family endonuclease [Moorena sp. SIO4G3]|uniref:Uma2 family endonuclease n=1 Tax=Moorena sp. SIO4G3 TaxID=2607821 RepID=UPI00343417E1